MGKGSWVTEIPSGFVATKKYSLHWCASQPKTYEKTHDGVEGKTHFITLFHLIAWNTGKTPFQKWMIHSWSTLMQLTRYSFSFSSFSTELKFFMAKWVSNCVNLLERRGRVAECQVLWPHLDFIGSFFCDLVPSLVPVFSTFLSFFPKLSFKNQMKNYLGKKIW